MNALYGLRVFCGWISAILVVVGLVAGLHEMTELYTCPLDQMMYTLGSMIGMMVYAAGVWMIYGLVALICRLAKKR